MGVLDIVVAAAVAIRIAVVCQSERAIFMAFETIDFNEVEC